MKMRLEMDFVKHSMDTLLRIFQALLVTLPFKINLPLTLTQRSIMKASQGGSNITFSGTSLFESLT